MSDTSEQRESKGEGETRQPEEIRADIERTRAELGDTATAVAEKTDVKAQAQEVKDKARDKAKEVTDQAAAKAKEVAPESAAPTIEKAQRFANEKPLAALGIAVAAAFVLRRMLRR